tara:strand:- start:611 stop:1726 length:1116 start_codon:yes stop_codon:yes gene_type:complete
VPSLEYYIGSEKDDAALRSVLHQTPMDGPIRMTFEREPSFFGVKNLEGSFHQTIVGKDSKNGKVFGVTNRSIRQLYFNGEIESVGYLGLMRLLPEYQTGFPALRGYQYCKKLHLDKKTKFYLTSIMDGNEPALKLLKSGVRGLPRYQEYSHFCTRSIPIRIRPKKTIPTTISIMNGQKVSQSALVKFLNQYGKQHQFYPMWTQETLFNPEHTPGLKPENMLVAINNEEIVGCMAMWDQRSIRQTVVKGYKNSLSKIQWLINGYSLILGYPPLPKKNSKLKSCFISHVAIDKDNPDIFLELLTQCHNFLIQKNIEYMVIGFDENHPFDHIVKSNFKNVPAYSRIYLVSWEGDGIDPLQIADSRLPGIEVAIL